MYRKNIVHSCSTRIDVDSSLLRAWSIHPIKKSHDYFFEIIDRQTVHNLTLNLAAKNVCCWRALASIFFRLWRNNDTVYLWLFLCRRNSRIDSWQCQLNRAGTVAIEVTRIIDADYVLAWHRFVGKDCENMTISRIPWPSKRNRRVLNSGVVPKYVSFNLRTNEWNILIGISSHSCVTRSWNLWILQIL